MGQPLSLVMTRGGLIVSWTLWCYSVDVPTVVPY
jgi:hypothetical protein